MLRPLSTQDIFIYRELRLQALQESPTAFGSSYEEESAYQTEDFAARLRNPQDPDGVVIGAFGEGAPAPLLGMVGFGRENRLKRAHSGFLWAGIAMCSHHTAGARHRRWPAGCRARPHARSVKNLCQVTLGVTSTNTSAVAALYQSRGLPLRSGARLPMHRRRLPRHAAHGAEVVSGKIQAPTLKSQGRIKVQI